mmetsp:Transcript_2885/g.2711  ORF Transcript_2885/g.2711 Transcript_2885/m.2711 type:complete len:99 (-) Transcript_2885:51-347(-)
MAKQMLLHPVEKLLVIFMHFVVNALSLLCVIILMQTYNVGYMMMMCFGFTTGHLIFGLVQDTIVIKKIKRERKYLKEQRELQLQDLKTKRTLSVEMND